MEYTDTEPKYFKAIVLAADREADNPVAKAAGVSCKSLAPINGTPMVFRVLEALSFSSNIKSILLCGPPKKILDQEQKLHDLIASGKVAWITSQATPSLSAGEAMKTLSNDHPILLTTSDHALLSTEIVDYFCRKAQASGYDVVVALARHETVMFAYPKTSRTAYRFKDGAFCSCNLFAFLTERSRAVPTFWRQVEKQRKSPIRVISMLGLGTVLRYLMRSLTLAEAVDRISNRLGCKIGIVVIPYPEAAIDVDSAEDWHLVQQIAGEKN